MTNFPNSIDTYVNPQPTDDEVLVPHATQHQNHNDSVIALETKVGANNSTVTTTHDYKLSDITGSNKALSSSLTGIPDAAINVKGFTRVSVAPVSATIPISVGDNDPRVPTQDENDALIGTSGTPSNTNRFVTNDDTSTTGSGSKIPRGVNGKIDATWLPSSSSTSFSMLAGENITAGQAVYSGVYQPTPIVYDNSDTFINTGSSSSDSFTIGSGTNRILIVSILLSSPTATVTSAQYNGIAMTLLQSDTSNVNGTASYLYSITNPTTGTNNLTFSTSASVTTRIIAYSFANVSGVSTSNKNISSTIVTSITESNIATGFVVGFGFIQSGGFSGSATSSSVQLPNNNLVSVGTPASNIAYFGGYSNEIAVAGSSTFSWTFVSNLSYWTSIYSVSLTPSNTAVAGYARLATASNAFLGGTDRYVKFLGIAANTATANASVNISAYLIDTLSGLTANSIYYLSDTKGAISTTAGTNSKKIGIAISTTTLVFKDNI